MHGADGRTSGWALTKRSGGRADGAHEVRTGGWVEEARTGPSRCGRADWVVGASIIHCADDGSGGWADGRTGGWAWV